mgnify:CR=1 FL=1
MKDFINKNWINILGGLFLFVAFLYFFELAIEEGWLPPAARVAIGLLTGISGLYYGYVKFKKQANLSAELLAGLGNAIVYATFAYASFSSAIEWSTNTIMISMLSFTSLVTFISYKYDMRKLGFISIFGGLITPVILKAPEEQVLALFIYVFILNAVSLYLSASKRWSELSIMSFIVTAAIYLTYYIYFDPIDWQKPTFYASSFFVVYFVGLLLPGFFDKQNFNGLNLYLGLINAINFIFWSILIFSSFSVPYATPTLFVGILFALAALVIYRKSGELILPSIAYFILSIVLIAISGSDLSGIFTKGGFNYLINAFIWTSLVAMVYFSAHYLKSTIARNISMVAWVFVLIYWFSVAWNVEWIPIFGVKFIPFLNPGALVWMFLASLGFIFSNNVLKKSDSVAENEEAHQYKLISLMIAIISHVVVGGLLTIQIQNLWDAYQLNFMKVTTVLSISWMVYALGLFLWGSYTNQKAFRFLGSAVVILTSLKVFIFDLRGTSTIYLVTFLFVLGLLTLLIARIDSYWRTKYNDPKPKELED